MPRIKFTARTIESLKPPESARIEYWDDGLPGFGLRISTEGRKTWVAMYRYHGRLRRLTLGTYPALSLADAGQRARDAFFAKEHDLDPAREKQIERKSETFEELVLEYLERHAKVKKKSWKEDKRVLKREFLPVWKYEKANKITRRDVRLILDRIVDRGSPIQANRALAIVRKTFNFAIQRDIIEINPCWKIPAPGVERKRDRVLSVDEMKILWSTLEGMNSNTKDYFQLLLLTGQRPGEVSMMEWSEIDFNAGWWVIPAIKAKNNFSHRVPLSTSAIEILSKRKEPVNGAWVFPSSKANKPHTYWKKALNKVRKQSGIAFRTHDLRRTVASHIASTGTPRIVIKKILNHRDSDITAVYDCYSYDREKRTALESWAESLRAIQNMQTRAIARSA